MRIILLEMPPLHLALLIVGATALLSVVGWLFVTQINTNKSFKDALVEFRVALSVMSQANKDQQSLCQIHQARMEKDGAQFKSDIHEINERLNEHLYESRPKAKPRERTNLSNHHG